MSGAHTRSTSAYRHTGSWRSWGRRRPLLGGVLTAAAGVSLLILPGASLSVVLLPGVAGTSGFLFGAGLCVLGLFLVFQPRSHAFAGVGAVIIAVASVVTTNLGGFGLGLVLGVLGGAFGFAWVPDDRGEATAGAIPSAEQTSDHREDG
nr:DUF6114 domain-containing protein [Pseudonocardia ammonioxydans]